MLMPRDFDLNEAADFCDMETLNEAFRKTMLTQQFVFQNQVHELHRVYQMQKTLMRFDRYDSNEVSVTRSRSQEFSFRLQRRPYVDHPESVGDCEKRKRRDASAFFGRDFIDLEESKETMSNCDSGNEQSCASCPKKDQLIDSKSRNRSLSSEKQQRSSYVNFDFDLNEVYCDDSSCHSNEQTVIHPSTTSSSYAFHELFGSSKSQIGTEDSTNSSGEANIEKQISEDDELVRSTSLEHGHIGENESSGAETAPSDVAAANPLSIEALSDKKRWCEELDAITLLTLEAAESLMHISFEWSVEKPQRSCDSFERLTLDLKDCAGDDVSSKHIEVDITEKKDSVVKIRRGRRVKDFQRDILPGMVSLSRHEIREDINILEGVLRSREYRKMQAENGRDGQSNWIVPARSRRSQLGGAKHRRYS